MKPDIRFVNNGTYLIVNITATSPSNQEKTMGSGTVYKTCSRNLAILSAFMIFGIMGCDPPKPVIEEEPPPVAVKRNIPLPTAPGMVENRKLVTVTEPGVSDSLLDSWTRYAPVTLKLPINARPELLEEIRTTAEVFNALPYTWNDELKQAIRESKKLKWLRVGANCRGEDLNWIGELKELRGLAFVNASLTDADFLALSGLSELRYLGCTDVFFPPTIEFPDFPKLEFLALDGKFVTDAHFPATARCPNVEVFTATWSQITDAKLAELIRGWPKLRYMFLARCESITGKSAAELAKLKSLRYLQVGYTQLSKDLYEDDYQTAPDLQLQLPNCHIGFGK